MYLHLYFPLQNGHVPAPVFPTAEWPCTCTCISHCRMAMYLYLYFPLQNGHVPAPVFPTAAWLCTCTCVSHCRMAMYLHLYFPLQHGYVPAPVFPTAAWLCTCTCVSHCQTDSGTLFPQMLHQPHRCSISHDPTCLQICTEWMDGRAVLMMHRISDLLNQFFILPPAEQWLI